MVCIENVSLCRSITYCYCVRAHVYEVAARRLLVVSPMFDGVEDMPGVTSLNDRGGAYDQGVYVCESKDMGDRHQLLKPEVYNLNLEQFGVLQGNLLGHVSAEMRSLRTNGDGACGMHAVFGAPEPARTGGLELFASDARNLAAQHLGPSLEALEARAGVQSQVHAIKTNFWDGFVVAHLKGPQTSESESFWRCLSFRFPGLAQEATEAFNMNAVAGPAYAAAKRRYSVGE